MVAMIAIRMAGMIIFDVLIILRDTPGEIRRSVFFPGGIGQMGLICSRIKSSEKLMERA